MSTTVRIPGPLRRYTNNADKVEVDAGDLSNVIHQLESLFPGIHDRLLDESGEMRYFVNVYLNGQDVRFLEGLQTLINDGDEVSIVPAVAGGSQSLKIDQHSDGNEPIEIVDDGLDLYKPDFSSTKKWKLLVYATSGLVLLALILPGILFVLGEKGSSSPEPKTGSNVDTTITIPDFSLPDANGAEVVLSQVTATNNFVILVFYRGYF